ncbi:MAG: hypothetical protein ACHQDE_01620 [Acidimicrobiia bacterium]
MPSSAEPPHWGLGGVTASGLVGRLKVLTNRSTIPGIPGPAAQGVVSPTAGFVGEVTPGRAPVPVPAVPPGVAPSAPPALVPTITPAPAPPGIPSGSVTAPAEAANNPAGPVTEPVAAQPAAPDSPAFPDLGAIGAFGASAPEAARELLTTPTGRSLVLVLALMVAILAFLGVHRRLDRRDLKLATARTAGDLVRFQ